MKIGLGGASEAEDVEGAMTGEASAGGKFEVEGEGLINAGEEGGGKQDDEGVGDLGRIGSVDEFTGRMGWVRAGSEKARAAGVFGMRDECGFVKSGSGLEPECEQGVGDGVQCGGGFGGSVSGADGEVVTGRTVSGFGDKEEGF